MKLFLNECLLAVTIFVANYAVGADLTLNLGYHNPPGALVGINFLWFTSPNWAAELGIGWIDLDRTDANKDKDKNEDTLSTRLGGDFNLKYFLTQGTGRVYLQGGMGVGLAASVGSGSGASAGAAGFFGGAGILIGTNKMYGYGSYNLGEHSQDGFFQVGLGFDI